MTLRDIANMLLTEKKKKEKRKKCRYQPPVHINKFIHAHVYLSTHTYIHILDVHNGYRMSFKIMHIYQIMVRLWEF